VEPSFTLDHLSGKALAAAGGTLIHPPPISKHSAAQGKETEGRLLGGDVRTAFRFAYLCFPLCQTHRGATGG